MLHNQRVCRTPSITGMTIWPNEYRFSPTTFV